MREVRPEGLTAARARERHRHGEGDVAISASPRTDPVPRVLFLEPPNHWFAAWTRPDGDRRPALLVAVLVVVLSAGLFRPASTTYSGLTDAAEPVVETVLPSLVLWFALLTAADHLRLPERALGPTGPLSPPSARGARPA